MAISPALRRITELFIEGTECVLDENEPVLVWVNKLNPFEIDEARKDGQSARTRFTLALEDPRSEESQLFDLQASRVEDEAIVLGLAASKRNEDMVAANEDLRADPEWADKVNLLDRADEQIGTRPPGDPERDTVDRVMAEYWAELDERVEAKRAERVADFKSLPREELRAKYRKEWIEQRGNDAFLMEFRITELFFCLRECKATARDDNGRWQHTLCDHRQKLLDDRAQVRSLPEGLVNTVRPILNTLAVEDRTAKDLGGGSKSSDSSQPPNAQEDSPVSTPAATPPGQATTSTPR